MILVNRLKQYLLMPLLLVLGACGGDDDGFPTADCGGPNNPCPPYAVSLVVTPKDTVLAVTTTQRYQALATYSDGSEKDVTATVIWQASEPKVAGIAATGKATALAAGRTLVRATLKSITPGVSDLTDEANLRVTDAVLTALAVTPAEAVTLAGLDKPFRAEAFFTDGHRQDVTLDANWSSLNTAAATVSNNDASKGLARGVSVGDAPIQASFGAVTSTGELIVLNSKPTALVVSPKINSMPKGTGVVLSANLLLENGQRLDVTAQSRWQAATPSVVSVDKTGFAFGLIPGQSGVTATLSFAGVSLSDVANITVTDAVLQRLSLTPAVASIPVGRTQSYELMGLFSDGRIYPVAQVASWQTSAPSIAAVRQQGIALGLQAGVTEVVATVNGLSAKARLKVEAALATGLVVTPGNVQVPLGYEGRFTAIAYFSDGSSLDVTQDALWQSGDTSLVIIEPIGEFGGTAKGRGVGLAEVSASFAGLTDSSDVAVSSAELSQYSIVPVKSTVATGLSVQYQAFGVFTDGSVQDLTRVSSWVTQDVAIASINRDGVAIGNKAGVVTVQGQYLGFKARGDLTVTAAVPVTLQVTPAEAWVPILGVQAYKALAIFSDGQVEDVTQAVAWRVADTGVATIVSGGLDAGNAIGLVAGKSQVSADYRGLSAVANLTVIDKVLKGFSIVPANSAVFVGTTRQFRAFAVFDDGSQLEVFNPQWQSLSPAVAFIDKTGRVKGLAEGNSQISATYFGMQANASLLVRPGVLTALKVTPESALVPLAAQGRFTAIATFDGRYEFDVSDFATWLSSAADVVQVVTFGTEGGAATALSIGSSTISALFGGLNAEATVEVYAPVAERFEVTPESLVLEPGLQAPLKATVHYQGGGSRDVTLESDWQSRNPQSATVETGNDQAGVVTGVSDNSGTVVTATYMGMSDFANVDVFYQPIASFRFEPNALEVKVGEVIIYTLWAVFDDGHEEDYTDFIDVVADDDTVVIVGKNGVVIGQLPGETILRARLVDAIGEVNVKVVP